MIDLAVHSLPVYIWAKTTVKIARVTSRKLVLSLRYVFDYIYLCTTPKTNMSLSFYIFKKTSFQDVIWTIVMAIPGNSHLRRDQLFGEVDGLYSLTQEGFQTDAL